MNSRHEAWITLYKSGWTIRRIAKVAQRSTRTVWGSLHAAGVPMRPRGRKRPPYMAEVAALLLPGTPRGAAQRLAKRYGVSRAAISFMKCKIARAAR